MLQRVYKYTSPIYRHQIRIRNQAQRALIGSEKHRRMTMRRNSIYIVIDYGLQGGVVAPVGKFEPKI